MENEVIMSTYTKDTNDGNLIKFDSECSLRFKIGTIVTLFIRAFKISSTC